MKRLAVDEELPGLGFYVTSKGKTVYAFEYQKDGESVTKVLGKINKISLKKARKKARRIAAGALPQPSPIGANPQASSTVALPQGGSTAALFHFNSSAPPNPSVSQASTSAGRPPRKRLRPRPRVRGELAKVSEVTAGPQAP